MLKGKRKSYDMFEISDASFLMDEIKNLLLKKNIFVSEQIDKKHKNIIINLIDKTNNIIGKINGGVGEFKIIENGEEMEKDAFSISWVSIENNYKGYNLGTFLIIYIIYLCKINFSDIEYIVLDDDSDERDKDNNIYYKLGFRYQETKEVELNNGQITTVNTSPEMQIKITDFFNNILLERLNKIKIRLRNLITYEGGKIKRKRKTKKITKVRSKKSKKIIKVKNKKYRKTTRHQH